MKKSGKVIAAAICVLTISIVFSALSGCNSKNRIEPEKELSSQSETETQNYDYIENFTTEPVTEIIIENSTQNTTVTTTDENKTANKTNSSTVHSTTDKSTTKKPVTTKKQVTTTKKQESTTKAYSCSAKNHHCTTPQEHEFIVLLEQKGCPYCGSHSCTSFYVLDEWGNACYDASRCPKYNEKNDPCEYCQVCGKKIGDGSNGTCCRFTEDTECPVCGKQVKEKTCHSH